MPLDCRGLLLDALGGLPGLVIGVVAIDRLGRLATLGVMQVCLGCGDSWTPSHLRAQSASLPSAPIQAAAV